MPVIQQDLQLDQGSSITFPVVWISGGVGVNPAGTIPNAIFRQLPTDNPLLVLTNLPGIYGVISYAAPIPNYTFFDTMSGTVITTTVYPINITISTTGMALLVYPVMRWRLSLAWPDGTVTVLDGGEVNVDSI